MISEFGLPFQNPFIFKFNHSFRWIKALNILLIQSTKNELNNSFLGRFALMNIYPTSATSQSPLSLKTNLIFKIAIQIIHQRECAEKNIWVKTAPKIRQQRYFWHCYNQLCLDSNLLHQCSFLSNQFSVTINCNVTTNDCNMLKITRKQHFKDQILVPTFHQTPYDHGSNWAWKFQQILRK